MRSDKYQLSLIVLGLIVTALLGVFFYRELFPEYKIYQNDYVALEKFRSNYTGEPPPAFKEGIKQIVIEREDKGPALVDRCVSCHVALQFSHFSPTQIAKDINGKFLYDEQGFPLQVPNEDYVWSKLDQAIATSKDSNEIEYLQSLKTARVGEHVYDVTKVLAAHPLIGRETRPFEFHPIEEYGCTSCHNGNGKGLTTPKAHGPVFDGEYEIEFMGYVPQFTESDPANDPKFSKVFNHKPGHELLFQTTPIFVGSLIQAKCVQCHQSSQSTLQSAATAATTLTGKRQRSAQLLQQALNNEEAQLISLLEIKRNVEKQGVAPTITEMQKRTEDYRLPTEIRERSSNQIEYLMRLVGGKDGLRPQNAQPAADVVLMNIKAQLLHMIGTDELVLKLEKTIEAETDISQTVSRFIVDNSKDKQATGTIFAKFRSLELDQALMAHIEETKASFETSVNNPQVVNALTTDVDLLTKNFQQGQNLFIAQACYACHRIAGFSRGGVGPELTQEGKHYPWFIKESIVWPQADLPTSTMPNFKMDHEEVENLVTYLLAQQGGSNAVSPVEYRTKIQEWEAGKKQVWEKSITPVQILDLDYSMTVFATEGCAACHRLKGFESNVGFRSQKEQKEQWTIQERIKERDWFKQLVPEMIVGSHLVQVLEEHAKEIDQHIVDDVRENALLERIEKEHPGIIESYNANFKYAMRARNSHYANLADQEKDPLRKAKLLEELNQWKQRVHRVMMMYIQEYGLGRLIGPRPNWSGVNRTDEWLMEHFRNPSNHVPKSIMPAFPFDESKFYSLTHMLDVLGKRNRDELREVWQYSGFNPQLAYETYCSQCHGEFLTGNGPVSEWIYPIPKNLRNADFLRNLTKERVIYSITHGIKGTPMPPWGEVATDKPHDSIPVLNAGEINRLADWLFFNIPGSTVIPTSEDVPKWRYTPEDVLRELKKEGGSLKTMPKEEKNELGFLPTGSEFFASLTPKVYSDIIKPEEVADVFDIIPDQTKGPDKNLYYIKKEYYTPENLQQGQQFFETNCAVCHGREGEGAGLRAGIMQDAKPRMLTNLGWINSRDDLRLLRSIKFGVPGTAMTPWGDLTSSFQRMQLVMFIRSLSKEHGKRDTLASALFQSFDAAKINVETARVNEFKNIVKLQGELSKTDADVKRLYRESKEGQIETKEAAEAYQKKLELLNQLREQEKKDTVYQELKTKITAQSEIYQSIGTNVIVQDLGDSLLEKVVQMIRLNQNRVIFEKDRLEIKADPEKNTEISKIANEIDMTVSQRIQELERSKILQEGKIPSHEQKEILTKIQSDLTALKKFKSKFLSGMEEIRKLQEREIQLYTEDLKI